MMLKIENLHATVGDTEILKGLSLTINAGEIHAIMGPNGAGKSTLAYALGGRPGYDVTEGSPSIRTNARRPVSFSASSIRSRFPACPTCSSCAKA